MLPNLTIMLKKNCPAALLDRDGVLNEVPLEGHVSCVEKFKLIPGALLACQRFYEYGYRIIIVTNQGGIARGYYTEDDYHSVNQKMLVEFSAFGLPLPEVYYCPYHPIEPVKFTQFRNWRKPSPGMIYAAAQQHQLCLSQSFMVGDNVWDIEAGRAAGVGRLIFTGPCHSKCPTDAVFYSSLLEVSLAMPFKSTKTEKK